MSNTLRLLSAIALFTMMTHAAAPKRSRAEAIPGMQASNTVGLGDIWIEASMGGQFRVQPVSEKVLLSLADSAYRRDLIQLNGIEPKLGRDMLAAPGLKAAIGLAGFLQLEIENVPWDGEKMGASRAGLKWTTPKNDELRLFGFAVMADATLSTEEDIYSRGETTPGFDPLFHFGAAADVDFIKQWPKFPVKLFVNWSNLADYRLAHAFDQQWGAIGVAWKGYRQEYFARTGLAWFKALPTQFDPNPSTAWVGPNWEWGIGARWFFSDRFWGNFEVSLDPFDPIAFYSDATHNPPKVFFGIEMPVFFQETGAEALRALIYTEEMRKVARRKAALESKTDKTQTGKASVSATSTGISDVKLEDLELKSYGNDSATAALKSLFQDQEQVGTEKRKRVRQELQHIEDLLP
jgi:hypothetical protein